MKKTFVLGLVLCVLIVPFLLAEEASPPELEKQKLAIFHSISSHDLLDMAAELCSPKYNGRLSGTPEYLKCAEWIAQKLSAAGLQPAGGGGSFMHFFDEPYTIVKNPGALVLLASDAKKGADKTFTFPADYFPGLNSDSGTVTGDVVYAGYGVTAPELKYDDYRGIPVQGKIVVVESGVPYQGNDAVMEKWAPFSSSRSKQANAAKHGAAGMLLVGKMANNNTSFLPGFVYCHVGDEVVSELVAGTGRILKEVRERINSSQKPLSFATGRRVSINASTEHHPEGKSCNVMALIPGSDPQLWKEAIILGAHLDGQGNAGILMPSALDNASGSADLLAAALALGRLPTPPKRTILFIFFGGEETGLKGSQLYCDEPLYPKENTVCMFNLDMAGNGLGLSLGGGLSYPLIHRHFQEANDRYLHRSLRASPTRQSFGRPRSDGAIFSRAGFRTLGIGTSERVKDVFYHDPGDTIETLTPEIMEDVAKWIFLSLATMANADALIAK